MFKLETDTIRNTATLTKHTEAIIQQAREASHFSDNIEDDGSLISRLIRGSSEEKGFRIVRCPQPLLPFSSEAPRRPRPHSLGSPTFFPFTLMCLACWGRRSMHSSMIVLARWRRIYQSSFSCHTAMQLLRRSWGWQVQSYSSENQSPCNFWTALLFFLAIRWLLISKLVVVTKMSFRRRRRFYPPAGWPRTSNSLNSWMHPFLSLEAAREFVPECTSALQSSSFLWHCSCIHSTSVWRALKRR